MKVYRKQSLTLCHMVSITLITRKFWTDFFKCKENVSSKLSFEEDFRFKIPVFWEIFSNKLLCRRILFSNPHFSLKGLTLILWWLYTSLLRTYPLVPVLDNSLFIPATWRKSDSHMNRKRRQSYFEQILRRVLVLFLLNLSMQVFFF